MTKKLAATERTLTLTDLTQGNNYLLVLTGLTVDAAFQFKHGEDPNWRDYPDFDGTAADVIMFAFTAPSPVMQVAIPSDNGGTWYASWPPHIKGKF